MTRRRLTLFLILLAPVAGWAQIPAGFVNVTATVGSLANGSFIADWTNLSGLSQLPLLGGVSSFQTQVIGNFDSNGKFSILLADTAQITPTPSTWTFSLSGLCPGSVNFGYKVAVAVTPGGSVEDISSQLLAAFPSNPCQGGGGGGGGFPSHPPLNSVQVSNGVGAFNSDPSILANPATHILQTPELLVPGAGTGLITLQGATSAHGVTQTVNPSTASWTYTWPLAAPTTNGNCLTSLTSGVSSWTPCSNVSGVINAALQPGSDIGAKVNAALASCADCEIDIPAGSYSFSTPIVIPVANLGTATIKGQGIGTVLSYTGSSGDAISATSTVGNALTGLHLSDFILEFNGSGSTANGIHFTFFNGGLIDNVTVFGFPNNCLLNTSNNGMTFFANTFSACKVGVHNIGTSGASANSLTFIGGEIGQNSEYGVYEDGTGGAFPDTGNNYIGVDFELNGTTASTNAQVFLQSSTNISFVGNYMEYGGSNTGTASVILGDSSHTAISTNFNGNFFSTFFAGSSTINDFNSAGTYYAGNREANTVVSFDIHGALSTATFVGGLNEVPFTANFFTGTDANQDTTGFFPAQSGFPNSISTSNTGIVINGGVSKTCTVAPTVVHGIVTAC
jgi:hypothetical protein